VDLQAAVEAGGPFGMPDVEEVEGEVDKWEKEGECGEQVGG
jgi:hypothetical protein